MKLKTEVVSQKNYKFYFQSCSDAFVKSDNVAFKGKNDDEEYIVSPDNIDKNVAFLDALSNGEKEK